MKGKVLSLLICWIFRCLGEDNREQSTEISWGLVVGWKVDPVCSLCRWDCGVLAGGLAGGSDVEEMGMEDWIRGRAVSRSLEKQEEIWR